MVTLNTIAYSILKNYRIQSKVSDDLDIRYVYNWINNARTKFLKQRLDKSTFGFDQSILQSLGPVEVELVDSSIFPGINSNKYFLRTKVDIPKTIDRSGHVGSFYRIGPADRYEIKYKITDFNDALTFGFGKFDKKDICAFQLDNRIYLVSRDLAIKNTKYIDIVGVFQDVDVAAKFTNPNYNENSPYALGEDMVHDIETMIFKENLLLLGQEKEDTNNNGANDIVNIGMGKK